MKRGNEWNGEMTRRRKGHERERDTRILSKTVSRETERERVNEGE
jgi:hypothetical protein